jgi:serine protease
LPSTRTGRIHGDDVPDNPYPAQIENLSLGASGVCTQPYLDTIAAVTARGTLVVVSAGNEGGPVDEPANCPGVAGIAGLRHVGTKVGYSSLGPEIAVAAPAGNCVNSTGACLFPINTTSNDGATIPGSSTYTDQLNANVGTSFAAPIVSGIVGLMLATNGNLSPAQLRSRLREGATAPFPVSSDPAVPLCHVPAGPMDFQGAAGTGECSCTTDTCGAGMANALGSVNAAARPIAAVSMPVNVSAGQRVALSAAGSSAACGRTLTSYEWTGPGLVTPPNEAAASFNVPTSGQVTATVTVTDDAGRTDSADVIIFPTSATTAAPAEAGSQACRASIPAPVPVTVTVDPATASINAGASQTFTATVAHSANTVVNWSVNGIVGGAVTTGTITTAGVFTAPALLSTALTVTVTATWSGDSSKSASSTVTLNPAPVQAQQSSGGGGGGGGAFGGLELFGLAAAALLRRGRVRRAATGA